MRDDGGASEAGAEPEAGGGTGPRPILVGAASLILLMVGLVELVLATIVLVVFGTDALAYSLLIGLLAAGAVVLGIRIRDGRNRTWTITVALVTMFLTPLTLGASLLGLAVGTGTMVVVIALVRHRAWFASAPPRQAGASAGRTRE